MLRPFLKKKTLHADLAQALNESASLYQTEGYPEKAVVTAKRAIALNEEIGDFRGQVEAYFSAGLVFFNYRLFMEALACFGKAGEISEKIGYIYRTGWAAIYSAITLDILGKLDSAVTQNLLANKYAEKTDSHYIQSQSLANLLGLYSKLGDLEKAEKIYVEIKHLFPDESRAGSKLGHAAMVKAEALFFAAKKDWEESNRLFILSFDLLKGALFARAFEATMRLDYAAVLDNQGRSAEAYAQRLKSLMFTEKIDGQFRNFDLETSLTLKKESLVGEEFEVRLDIVNVSRCSGFLLAINNLYSPSFNVCKMPTQYVLAKGSLDLKKQSIEPFQFLTFKFSLYAVKEGIFSFAPEIIYMDEIGNRKICVPNPASIKISPVRQLNESPGERAVSINFANLPSGSQLDSAVEFEFKNETSKKVFEFLVGSFVEDYMRLRLPVEKSGWRTSMDAVKHGKVPFSAVYGRKGRSGRVISELQRKRSS